MSTMKVIRIHTYGPPEVMQLEELPMPAPGPGQVLVRVMAAGVNYFDAYVRSAPHESGFYPEGLPLSPGAEGAGIVEAVGQGVGNVRVGERVGWGGVTGSYATHALIPSYRLIPLPNDISFEQAASSLSQGVVAHSLCHSVYPLKPGDTCLIHTVAGGVGLLLCQMAKIRKANVIGITSSPEKARIAYAAGADEVIISTQTNFETEVRRLTDGRGVNVIYDAVGKDTFEKNLNSLAVRGFLVLYGQMSGPVPPIDSMVLAEKGSLYLTRPAMLHYLRREELPWRVQDLFRWITEGVLHIRYKTYPLREAAEAHRALENRQSVGKLILLPEHEA